MSLEVYSVGIDLPKKGVVFGDFRVVFANKWGV
jgi:hypothetical protein